MRRFEAQRMEAVVCGIDPGLGATGYAVVGVNGQSGPAVLDAGVCRSDARVQMPERLVILERDLIAILDEHQPTIVAVEQLYSHYNHPRTAILMGHARGVILLAAGRMGIDVRSYSATRIKRFLTGNGRASKTQVQRAVQVTLGLSRLPEPADVADALAIALCCAGDQCRATKRPLTCVKGWLRDEATRGCVSRLGNGRSAIGNRQSRGAALR